MEGETIVAKQLIKSYRIHEEKSSVKVVGFFCGGSYANNTNLERCWSDT